MQGKRKQIQKLNILFASIILMLSTVVICIYVRGELTAEDISPATIRLNEICSSNFSVSGSEDGNYYDYIELYNPTDKEISLEGYGLSDNTDNLQRFVFGSRKIAPGGYVLVYAAGENADEANAPFKISNQGETLFLTDNEGNILDVVAVPAGLNYNTSYSRSTDASGTWEVLEATPGYSNDGAAKILPENLEPPVFSAESGFYEEPFFLELQAQENERIFYTLDGSEPSEESIPYETPIPVIDASVNENVHSARTDLSAGFFVEEDCFEVPLEKVDKAIIVRATVFDEKGTEKSKTITKTFFVGYKEKGYSSFPVISLVTDPNNLFDYEKGIYVSGKRFDEFVSNGERDAMSNPDNWYRWKGNYTSRGREWERPIHMEYFDAFGNLIFPQEIGIRIKGNATRALTQKSFKLYAREVYNETDKFMFPFFGNFGKSRVVLYAGGNDYKTKIKDVLANEICERRSFSTMKNFPCYVFLNGEYWGVYQLMENYGEEYIEEHYGVLEEDVEFVKNTSLDIEMLRNEGYFDSLGMFGKSYDILNANDYKELEKIIDMQSYIDYYGAEIYMGNEDWPRNNEGFWRSKELKEQPYYDGKWRWMLFDVNFTALSDSVSENNTIAHAKEKSALFRVLVTNETFKERFVISFCDMQNTIFRPENVIPILNRYAEIMRGPAIKDLKKYYGENKIDEYDEEIEDIKSFFVNRPVYVTQHLITEFGLTGTLENVSVGCSKGGSVLLNTVEIPEGTECWTGQYFTDYPIRVTAIPAEGYRFVGWNGDVVSSAAEMEVTIKTGGMVLQAVFEKE